MLNNKTMSNVQTLIDSTHQIIRLILTEQESLKSSNTVTRFKIESSIKKNLESLKQQTFQIENSSQNLPLHERSRILQIVKDLKENYSKLSQNMRTVPKTSIELSFRSSEDYSSLSNAEIFRSTEMMKKEQDKHIDRLLETVENVKNTTKDMGDELDYHIKLLDATESVIDSTTIRITNTSERMLRLIDKSSNNCLMAIIILLLALILITLFYF